MPVVIERILQGQDQDLSTQQSRLDQQRLSRSQLESYQLGRLNSLLSRVLPHNLFYQAKFGCKDLQLNSLSEFATLPTSQKSEWLGADASGLAKHHTFPQESYRRYHRTSGTRGRPMVILDTQQDWQWWIDTWQYVLDACKIRADDRIMMAFSFGPFIGFWSAHDACLSRGCMVIPCGGMSTAARIDLILSAQPSVLFSTPSYALHLAQDAADRNIDLSSSSVRQVFVAGEPGGSVPAIRSKIESMFGAQVMDHAGATEVGPWGFSSHDGLAMHVIESEFIAEFLPLAEAVQQDLVSDDPMRDGVFELVLTSLGRVGAPVIRYRTGDLVRPEFAEDGKCNFVRLLGGVIGRADDMFVVRGVNIFPSSIDAIVRSFRDVNDYRLTVSKEGAMDELNLEVECNGDSLVEFRDAIELSQAMAEKLAIQLNLRFGVTPVPSGTLPRFEGKAKRIFDRRPKSLPA